MCGVKNGITREQEPIGCFYLLRICTNFLHKLPNAHTCKHFKSGSYALKLHLNYFEIKKSEITNSILSFSYNYEINNTCYDNQIFLLVCLAFRYKNFPHISCMCDRSELESRQIEMIRSNRSRRRKYSEPSKFCAF